MKVLVIIPAYNEEKNIKNVISYFKKHSEYDYIVINDCSKDGTEKILSENGANYVSLPVNLGIGGCVQTGYAYAVANDYDVAVQMDGDGQHNPKYLQNIVEPVLHGEADMVIGSRFIDKKGFQSSALRRMGIKWLSGIIKCCCGVKIYDTTSGFRACSKELTRYFASEYAQDYPEPEAILSAVLNGYKIKEVPVLMNEREFGHSSINGFKSAYYMIKVTISLLIHRFRIRGKKVK